MICYEIMNNNEIEFKDQSKEANNFFSHNTDQWHRFNLWKSKYSYGMQILQE